MPAVINNIPSNNNIPTNNNNDNEYLTIYEHAVQVCDRVIINRSIDNTITDLEEAGWDEEFVLEFLDQIEIVTEVYQQITRVSCEEQLQRIRYFIGVYEDIIYETTDNTDNNTDNNPDDNNNNSTDSNSTDNNNNSTDNNSTDNNTNNNNNNTDNNDNNDTITDCIQPMVFTIQNNNIDYASQPYYNDYVYHNDYTENVSQENLSAANSLISLFEWEENEVLDWGGEGEIIPTTPSLMYVQPQTL